MSNIPQQSGDRPLLTQEALFEVHKRLCDEYERVESQRSTQLTSLPSATVLLGGASVFLGATNSSSVFPSFVLALGFLGMFATFGLFFHELELEIESKDIFAQLMICESSLHIPGDIVSPHQSHKIINQETAALLIYASSFTLWFCVATWFVLPRIDIFVAIVVLVVIFFVFRRMRQIRIPLPIQMRLGTL